MTGGEMPRSLDVSDGETVLGIPAKRLTYLENDEVIG